MQYGDLKLGAARNVSQFQGEDDKSQKQPTTPLVDRLNAFLKRDATATVDVRTTILTRRLASLPVNSAERLPLERKLAEALKQRSVISTTINSIAQKAFEVNRGDYYELVTTHRMKLTQHDCYIAATQHIHEKCFDLENVYVLDKLWIVANLCEVGLRDFTINNAVDEVCNARQNFDY